MTTKKDDKKTAPTPRLIVIGANVYATKPTNTGTKQIMVGELPATYAAAHDLLAALTALLSALPENGKGHFESLGYKLFPHSTASIAAVNSALEDARAAIAKAEGK